MCLYRYQIFVIICILYSVFPYTLLLLLLLYCFLSYYIG
uniref:Uncharacterized protein n=1 Tax=Symphyocladiella dendroidea TaxID=2506487 RepID=A0A1Z1M788_9FLOR|nr:hypothetical protein [Symphyocladiella dendroidea]ARW61957.1 hypothetical protein [Symphyocladiella dendroidea]